jgi:hypothetical protein
MTLGLMPVIGIPLPFISYGGSSLLSFTVLLFIFIRLDANKVNELRAILSANESDDIKFDKFEKSSAELG